MEVYLKWTSLFTEMQKFGVFAIMGARFLSTLTSMRMAFTVPVPTEPALVADDIDVDVVKYIF